MLTLDRRQFRKECQDCKHKSKEMEWKAFRLDIYQDYPEPCKECLLRPIQIYFETGDKKCESLLQKKKS